MKYIAPVFAKYTYSNVRAIFHINCVIIHQNIADASRITLMFFTADNSVTIISANHEIFSYVYEQILNYYCNFKSINL